MFIDSPARSNSPMNTGSMNRTDLLGEVRERFRQSQLMSIADMHKLAAQDRPAKGPIWISRVSMKAPPEDDLRQALFRAMDRLSPYSKPLEYPRCPAVDVPCEWVAYRPTASPKDPEPRMKEEEKYHRLSSSVSEDAPTILYLHGGGFIAGSPVLSRAVTSQLAKFARGRVFAVQYRLAPSDIMPSQLLDTLVAYLSLVNPPIGALHKPIPASRIVLAAESSGSCLALGVTLFLLHVQRQNEVESVMFNGKPLPSNILPAGHAIASCMFYANFELLSFSRSDLMDNDILLPGNPLHDRNRADEPGMWPTDPLREHWSTPRDLLSHPLIEPMLTPDEMWEGAPPVWLATGEQRTMPATRVLAQTMRRANVKVSFSQFEKMCHIWFMVMPNLPSSTEALRRWGIAANELAKTGNVDDGDLLIEDESLKEGALDPLEEFATRKEWNDHARGIRKRNAALEVWQGSSNAALKPKI